MMNFGNCFGHVYVKNKLETESYKMPSSNVFNAVEPRTTSFYYTPIACKQVRKQASKGSTWVDITSNPVSSKTLK